MKYKSLSWGVILHYSLFAVMYCVALIVGMVLAPVLPMFAENRIGPVNNNNGIGVEPRLPTWLSWFDTYKDNSLYGDNGWRTEHCPKYWNTYFGMVLWLWRNPVAGFSWSVLAANMYRVYVGFKYKEILSYGDLSIDKSHTNNGKFLIQYVGTPYFHYRCIKTIWKFKLCFESGWLLDVYIKDRQSFNQRPKALFIFQPQLKMLKK